MVLMTPEGDLLPVESNLMLYCTQDSIYEYWGEKTTTTTNQNPDGLITDRYI